MEAIILAGGIGKRLRSVVGDVPKPMALVSKRPFLEVLMDFWIAQGIKRFVLAIGYKHELIERYFGRSYKGVAIDYSIELTLLGTGGGFLNTVKTVRDLGNSFLVLNGDTYFEVSLDMLSRFHTETKSDWTIALKMGAKENRYGTVELDSSSRIMAFREKIDSPRAGLINGGVYMVNRAAIEDFSYDMSRSLSLEEELLPVFVEKKKRLFGFPSNGKFIDIGIPEDYKRACHMFG